MKRYAKLLAKLLGGSFLLLIALVVLLWIVVPVPDEAQQAPEKKAPQNAPEKAPEPDKPVQKAQEPEKKAPEPESIPRKSGRYK
jgi:hypothetical protein